MKTEERYSEASTAFSGGFFHYCRRGIGGDSVQELEAFLPDRLEARGGVACALMGVYLLPAIVVTVDKNS